MSRPDVRRAEVEAARQLRKHGELRALRGEEQRQRRVDRPHAPVHRSGRHVDRPLELLPRDRTLSSSGDAEGRDGLLGLGERALRAGVAQHRARLVRVDHTVAVGVVRVKAVPQLVLLQVLEAEWSKRDGQRRHRRGQLLD